MTILLTLVVVLRILAFLCFCLAAIGASSKINLTAAGLALFTLALLLPS